MNRKILEEELTTIARLWDKRTGKSLIVNDSNYHLLFNKYLLSAYYVLGLLLNFGNTLMIQFLSSRSSQCGVEEDSWKMQCSVGRQGHIYRNMIPGMGSAGEASQGN